MSRIEYNEPFLKKQLITYIGNKRALLPFIDKGIRYVQKILGKKQMLLFDGFSGSGVVSRLLKYYAQELYVNDLEEYSRILNICYLRNKSEVDEQYIEQTISELNSRIESSLRTGFIAEHYAPKEDMKIQKGERVFYTRENAQRIDTFKYYIYKEFQDDRKSYFLGPLLVSASIHTNTSGVFKGFHKENGIGCFGGRGKHALSRIMGRIELENPLCSEVECPVHIYREDITELIQNVALPEYDLVYYDPPYNQHPYGSNYFMLNIISNPSEEISIQEGVSGISKEWNRSVYNKKQKALSAMDTLLANTKSKYILLSYNNEGIIPYEELKTLTLRYGKITILEQDYSTYKGCRNLHGRKKQVKELLWIIETH